MYMLLRNDITFFSTYYGTILLIVIFAQYPMLLASECYSVFVQLVECIWSNYLHIILS